MKAKGHKYTEGDLVGVCADCMADCVIVKCLPKKPGVALSYVASAVKIHHPKPKTSFFGQNKEFEVGEKQIVVHLGRHEKP